MKKTTAIVDCRICEQSVNSLIGLGFHVIKTPPFSRLSTAVESHPDMLMCIVGDTLITHRQYYEENKELFALIEKLSRLNILLSDEEISDKYPSDILFNAFIYEKSIFARLDKISSLIRDLESIGYNLCNVRQGYAACSSAFTGGGVITADQALFRAFTQENIPSLLIESGHISLPCHDYGFIGGASGYADGVMYFNGDVDMHPSGKNIREFACASSTKIVKLCDGMLTDVGKILFV